MDYDVIIIGAGASGLIAAIAVARQGSSVLVIEQKEKAGKKILATGNGKCNFTNMVQSPECYRSDDSAFAMKVLSCFDLNKTLKFFDELGIYPKNRDGYLYPNSEQASSIVQVLLMECERLKVKFAYNEVVTVIKKPNYTVVTEIVSIEMNKKNKAGRKEGNKEAFNKIASNNKTLLTKENDVLNKKGQIYHSRNLIIAAGGCASPQLGSDGSGFRFAHSFGHTIIKPLPALVQLKSPEKYCKTISGVRTAARVTAFAMQKQIAEEKGEILFTDYGVSGIPILQISRFVAKAIEKGEKVHLLLDFLPEISGDVLENMLHNRIIQNAGKSLEEMMVGLLNHKLSYIIINKARLDVYKNVKLITKQEIKELVKNIKAFDMSISETNTFENAQVCAGGVSTKEIMEETMESKFSKNLYLVGELVDVDGTCGGYNLQWAWSSGYVAGIAAGKK